MDAPPTKRARYNLRSRSSTAQPTQKSRYWLRSSPNASDENVPRVQIEPKRKRPKLKPFNLIPDCMLKVFEFMRPIDLCNTAETCASLYNLAKYYFRLKYRHFHIASLMENDRISIKSIEQLFRLFGDQIHSLTMPSEHVIDGYGGNISNRMLKLVDRYCRHIVKDLKIDSITMIEEMPFLSSLETLTVEAGLINDMFFYNLTAYPMNNLKVLRLHSIYCNWDVFAQYIFPNLEEIDFYDIAINTYDLHEFLAAHGSMKRISIVGCIDVWSLAFTMICRCQHLEALTFQKNRQTRNEAVYQRNLMRLLSLEQLKVLILDCNRMSASQLIDGYANINVPIDHLELSNGEFDLVIASAIAKLTSIKVLKFCEMSGLNGLYVLMLVGHLKNIEEIQIQAQANFFENQIKDIVDRAIHLKCLKIDARNCTIGIETYGKMLNIIKKRVDKTPLEITIYGNEEQLTIPDATLDAANKQWLSVKKLNRNHHYLFPNIEFQFGDEDEFGSDEEEFIDDWD